MIKRFDFVLLVMLIIIIFLLCWKISDMNGKIRKGAILENPYTKAQKDYFGTVIPPFSLDSAIGGTSFAFSPEEKGPFYLFIFFTPWDCQDCFKEIPFWNRIAENFGDKMRVIAIASGDSRAMIEYFVKKNGIKIPAYYDENENLFNQLGLRSNFLTPAKIITNSKGTILHISPSTRQNIKLQEEYITLLNRLVS